MVLRVVGSSPITVPNFSTGLLLMNQSYWVYIIYSDKFNRYYIGQTSDFEGRIDRHNRGYEKSTKPYIPWVLVCCLEKNSRSESMILEKKLKNLNIEDLSKFITKYAK